MKKRSGLCYLDGPINGLLGVHKCQRILNSVKQNLTNKSLWHGPCARITCFHDMQSGKSKEQMLSFFINILFKDIVCLLSANHSLTYIQK